MTPMFAGGVLAVVARRATLSDTALAVAAVGRGPLGYTASAALGSLARTRGSWLRDLMSSLVKTLCRWYSTVLGLMNSCGPISGFERPSLASRAVWGSLAVAR